jgi:SSS family solute:Na+ symporter
VCFGATVVVSLLTRPTRAEEELRGLVYSLTERRREPGLAWFRQPALLGGVVLAAVVVLNILFW